MLQPQEIHEDENASVRDGMIVASSASPIPADGGPVCTEHDPIQLPIEA